MQRLVAVGVGAVVVLLLMLAWIGGEVHYRNCLTKAELSHPVAEHWMPGHPEETSIGGGPLNQPPESRPAEPAHFVFYGQQDRNAALNECSRWPF